MSYIFYKEKIVDSQGNTVMHEWEHPLMKAKADWICQNGGDILELGFGMGISANYIQEHNINSHTICENHPDVIVRLKEWAKDKDNVIILEGDWYDNLSQMLKYNGIHMDTYDDKDWDKFPDVLPQITMPGCAVTWWNGYQGPGYFVNKEIPNTNYEVIDVDPPENDYFNEKRYFLPKCIYG